MQYYGGMDHHSFCIIVQNCLKWRVWMFWYNKQIFKAIEYVEDGDIQVEKAMTFVILWL
jgi:hypothetical protein